jgi:hypothetical protein
MWWIIPGFTSLSQSTGEKYGFRGYEGCRRSLGSCTLVSTLFSLVPHLTSPITHTTYRASNLLSLLIICPSNVSQTLHGHTALSLAIKPISKMFRHKSFYAQCAAVLRAALLAGGVGGGGGKGPNEELRKFAHGDRVTARWLSKGQEDAFPDWYPATVTKVLGYDSYTLKFDDGCTFSPQPASMIRAVGAKLLGGLSGGGGSGGGGDRFNVGDQIKARYKRRAHYYNGVVTAVPNEGHVNIRYDDGDKEDDVEFALVRHRDGGEGGVALGGAGGNDEDGNGGDDGVPLNEGDRIEARYASMDHWFRGRVAVVNGDGTYNIDYDDGDKERDVPADFVRRRTSRLQ